MKESDQLVTSFITPFGMYYYVTMPFGLRSIGATYQLLDCYSGQFTRGVPSGRVSGWGSQDQELDGNTKMQGLRQVRAAMSVIHYVLCLGLY